MQQPNFQHHNAPVREQGQNYGGRSPRPQPDRFDKDFDPQWISEGVNQGTVTFADDLGKFLKDNGLTTSQIRNVFGEIKRIQMKGFDNEKSSFYLLKPKMAYAASRVDGKRGIGINTFKKVFDLAHGQVDNEATYKNFVDFFEAILAYHKAYGGKD